ncbi:Diaminopimelate epimerase-like protein [Microstroma glucosiphilum]|uniref:Diaminopimelate epimerase-like protein n=1 Tax=Pseudomicrostroma glucosiphilum TaxID=1684307 RepID=A0A316TZF5_9BASI|nr:Diaminopimelate epimerase-like protein [Pseudomicrostroma glucosiphilum]PWN18477.1 Diaminopimelate epimerase-like protein [Pseudomicrostroma glucosiphilum]
MSTSPRARGFVQNDVFSSVPLLGNPVAVVLDGRGLSTETMALFARWTNLSETTFILPPSEEVKAGGKADYRLRILTPFGELPFAGHPTLGSCQAWLDHISSSSQGQLFASGQSDIITQECGVGLVKIKRDGATGRLALAAPGFTKYQPGTEEEIRTVCQAMGIERGDVLKAQWICNGPRWFGLLLRSAQAVLNASLQSGGTDLLAEGGVPFIGLTGPYRPAAALLQSAGLLDEAAVATLTEEVEKDGTPSASLPSASPTEGAAQGEATPLASWEVRAIFEGIEDPVTGSLNAGFARWLVQDEGLAQRNYVASQGKCMDRRGRVYVNADGDAASGSEKGEIWIGGDTSEVIRGEVRL